MIATISKTTAQGIDKQSFEIKELKCDGELLALDIVGIGWRIIELGKDCASFTVTE